MTQAFNLSQLANKVNTSGQLDASTGLYNATPAANGGTGQSTLTLNNVLLGNGTSAVQFVAPGTSGNVLQSNGTTWTSAALSVVPQIQTQTIASGSGTWSKPTTGGYQWVKIEIWGGGGSGGRCNSGNAAAGGGGGAYNVVIVPLSWLAASESYTVGAGAAARTTSQVSGLVGGTSTFNITNAPNGAVTISAFGGGGGDSASTAAYGGGGGGIYSAGATGTTTLANNVGGSPQGGFYISSTSYILDSVWGGGAPGNTNNNNGGASVYGGGGGGGGYNTGGTLGIGGASLYGGGGGGGSNNTTVGAGGASQFGGDGSSGAINSAAATAGATPAGGGGGAENANSGAGGDGRVTLTWW